MSKPTEPVEEHLFDPTPWGKGRERRITKKPDRVEVKLRKNGPWVMLRHHKNVPKAHILDTEEHAKKSKGFGRVQGHQGSYLAMCGYVGGRLMPEGEPVALACADCRRITGINE